MRTVYDEHDQPTEMVGFNEAGRVLYRIVRTYDEKRKIVDFRVIIEDPTCLFPGKESTKMFTPGALVEKMKAHLLKKALGQMMGETRKSFRYDSEGRRTKVVLQHGKLAEISRTYTYNDRGDVMEEETISAHHVPAGVPFQVGGSGKPVFEKPPSESPAQPPFAEPSVVRYSYQYDSFGNWTEKVSTSSNRSHTWRRELTYY